MKITSKVIILLFTYIVGVTNLTYAATTDKVTIESLQSDINKLKESLKKSGERIDGVEKTHKESNAHNLNDINEYKSKSEEFIQAKIDGLWNGSLLNIVLTVGGVVLTFGAAVYLALRAFAKMFIESNSKQAMENHAKGIHDELIVSQVTISGQHMYHWWLYYKNHGGEYADEFQETITALAEMTMDTVSKIPDSNGHSDNLNQYVMNIFYYLADTNKEKYLSDRRTLVKSKYKIFEKRLTSIPNNLRDIMWAERMECLCFAMYKFELKSNRAIKKYLDEIITYQTDSANITEIKDSYPKIYS